MALGVRADGITLCRASSNALKLAVTMVKIVIIYNVRIREIVCHRFRSYSHACIGQVGVVFHGVYRILQIRQRRVLIKAPFVPEYSTLLIESTSVGFSRSLSVMSAQSHLIPTI